MRLAIIGAGALGGVIGFYLAPHTDLVLVDPWPAHVAAINADGLQCECDGSFTQRQVRAVSDPALAAPADLALVLVKARQTPWAAEACRQVLSPSGVAYTLQNGLGHRERLAEVLGTQRVGQGVTNLGATLLGPGRVRHAGGGATMVAQEPVPELAIQLVGLFEQAGLPAEVRCDIEGLVWGKLLVNVGINALTALLRVPNGVLAAPGPARDLLIAAVHEAAAVAAARGVQVPYNDPVAHVLAIAEATASNRSSMLQDVLRGVVTEVEAINGAVAREGARLGVPTPLNATLTQLIAALEVSAAQRIGAA